MKKLIALKHKLDEMKAMGTNAKKRHWQTWMTLNKAWFH